MKMDNKMVFVFLLFMVAIVHNARPQSTANAADEENHVEPTDRLTVVLGDGDEGDQHAAESVDDPQHQQHEHEHEHEHEHGHGHEYEHGHEHEHEHEHEPVVAPTTETVTGTAASALKKGDRSGRQMYHQPFAYQPAAAFPQRRAYRGPKKRPPPPPRNKSAGGRRPRPRGRRRPSGPPSQSSAGRYRRLPGPVRQQQFNYIDAPPADYYDDADVYEQAGPQPQSATYADYVEQRELERDAAAYASPVLAMTTGRSRKRPAVGGYADEPHVVHVPVLRVIRPTVVAAAAAVPTAAPASTTADPMEKLRQLVHEAMDAHFANRHQDLYAADGTFDNKRQQHVYSAKYKRQPAAADRDKEAAAAARVADRSTASAVAPRNKDLTLQYVSYATPPPPQTAQDAQPADADADGSDDRLTLAEISAYMGAKPAETVLSAGGHRYVLSDALQQTYRHHHQQQQQQQEQHSQYNGDGLHQYLRYVSPFEAMYELPAARWAYK